jgi:hypothetical protein
MHIPATGVRLFADRRGLGRGMKQFVTLYFSGCEPLFARLFRKKTRKTILTMSRAPTAELWAASGPGV